MMTHLLTIARLELTAAARLKWIRLLTIAFALLASAAAYSAGAAAEMSGADGFARTTMALVPVVLILVPLAALILGVSGQAAEPGGEPFLFGQPVARATVVIGRWLGESAALGGALVVGLGIGGLVVAFGSGADGLPQFVFFVCAAVVLAVTFCRLRQPSRRPPTHASSRSARAPSRGVSSCCCTTARRCRSPDGSPDRSAAACCSDRSSEIPRT
jgi:ABC-type transport system involved in multi-copper enzyme maturation permease subunit